MRAMKAMRITFWASALLWLFVAVPAIAIETAPRISDREIVERLTRLEDGQRRLEQRLDDFRAATDHRFEAMDRSINQRFEAMERQMNQRFDDLKWFLGTMLGTLLVINTGVLGYVLRRQGMLEKSIETIKDELAFLKSVIEKLLAARGGQL